MKKAFTLIELLVVIAIIAILAAILFPVFAQAKTAAKKAVSLSNQKQIGLAIIMYAGDYDDMYPEQDGCTLNDSLESIYNVQPAGTDPTPWCQNSTSSGLGGYAFRDNHYAWQKWVVPYTKSVGLFSHPAITALHGTQTKNGVPTGLDQGEIANGYALNIALTGSLNTWHSTANTYGTVRSSFTGGTQTGVASPAEAMLTTELWFEPVVEIWEYPDVKGATTGYPAAFREHWAAQFYKSGGTGACGEQDGVADSSKTPFNVVPVGYADGHVKAMAVGDFLGKTPTFAQYTGGSLDTYACPAGAAYYSTSLGAPQIAAGAGQFPLWGL